MADPITDAAKAVLDALWAALEPFLLARLRDLVSKLDPAASHVLTQVLSALTKAEASTPPAPPAA